ncbi:hypothetical protein OIU77_022025 [Salix suchowensis]|uniref:AT hook motif-containing protein n=1 Tax=Salix suchowensis TaxID=1278906 RepID=A0ABQ9CBZ2_9ROSI|nr:hypothetical protein OIU77_022025 [Salix suchowensis]
MNPLSQGTSSSPADPPMKRKRGRPRKDESTVLGEKTPVITGVIDGLFDAGYFVKVKVEDSDTTLRGLVFQPGRFIPITAENDVAPQAKMYRRADIPIPVSPPPTQMPSFATSPKQNEKQPVELKKLTPTVQDKGLQSGVQSTVPVAKESLSASQMLPQTEYLQSSPGPLFGGSVMPPQVLGSGHENQPASATAEMGHNKIAGQHDWLQEFEASLSKGPDLNVKANEQFKSVSLPSPPADMLPVSEIRKQPFGDDLKLNQPVHDGVKIPCSLMEKQDSPKIAGSSEPAMKIISGDDTSHLNGSPIPIEKLFPPPQKNAAEGFSLQRVIEPQSDVPSGATNIMKAGVDISAMTSLPATLFGREAVLPESKAAADEPVLPKMTEPQPCNSPDVTSNVDSNIKDVIPPAES